MGAKPGTNIKAKVMQWARVLLLIIKTLQVLAVLTVSFRSIFLFLIWSPRPDELKTAHNFWNSRAWNLNFQRDEAFHKLRGCTHTDYAYWCWFMKLFQSACRSWLPSVHLKMSWDVWCSPCLRSKYLHAHENKQTWPKSSTPVIPRLKGAASWHWWLFFVRKTLSAVLLSSPRCWSY